jgi:hypothetical protein
MVSGNPWIFCHLGHDTMYIAEVIDDVEELAATPFIAFLKHSQLY